MKIERIYHPYWKWEDRGMYSPFSTREVPERREKAIKLLTDSKEFEKTAREMVKAFKHACEHNLTNPGLNRIAYIGQASCFYKHDIREDETSKAWGYLTEQQRNEANSVAEKILKEWENEYVKNHAG